MPKTIAEIHEIFRKEQIEMPLPKHYHLHILEQFQKGSCYIYCGKCEKTTLHDPLKIPKVVAKIDGKVVAFNIKYRCKECGNIVTFQRKII